MTMYTAHSLQIINVTARVYPKTKMFSYKCPLIGL